MKKTINFPCRAQGCTRDPFSNPQGRAAHERFAHGIAGAKKTASARKSPVQALITQTTDRKPTARARVEVAVRFCPCCKTDMWAVAAAVKMSS